MTTRTLFPTLLYDADLGDETLIAALTHSIHTLAADDTAGRRWSGEHGYKGYTSYASLNDLTRRDPAFADLGKLLVKHAAIFAAELAFDLPRKPRLDSLWVNLLKSGGQHSGHIHPHSILSGTLYVEVPPKAGAIRFEDPRLPQMMAAPTRRPDAPEELRPFVTIQPRTGQLLLWESFFRHEVLPGTAKADRLSVSFNFA
ncbi:TIGR02466 family protein [Sphingomonas sp.]|uniref:TIGR02466 family protein n=1 Tax=Sphingomonas sp. TaxID=28214 RepID=UPI00286B04BC|nr:TIGR02466 family protein [Sphingomonas sp.]